MPDRRLLLPLCGDGERREEALSFVFLSVSCFLLNSARTADRHDMPQSCLPLYGRRIGEASRHLPFDYKSGGANTSALVVGGFVRKNAAERGCGQETYEFNRRGAVSTRTRQKNQMIRRQANEKY